VLVWVVGISGICIALMVWVLTMYPVSLYWQSLDALNLYPPEASGTLTLVHNVAGWTLLALVVGLLVWMLLSSFRREDQAVPIPGV